MGLRVVPLAFESMGVRSQATLVETPDLRVVIDPGVALGPLRFSLPPHPRELEREAEMRARVAEEARRADALVVSHYHHDHFDPPNPGIMEGKVLYLKHPTEAINRSQRGRAAGLLNALGTGPKRVEFADGREFRNGRTTLAFSPPLFHGPTDRLGYVVEVCVAHGGERMVFASDVEGPPRADQLEFMLGSRPDLLLVDGPMTYMLGYRYSQGDLDASIEHLVRLVKETEVETLIVDHHFLRDAGYAAHLGAVREVAKERDVRVLTAAEFAGRPVEPLEARRRELYREAPAERRSYTRFSDG